MPHRRGSSARRAASGPILLDLNLPGLDGRGVLDQIKTDDDLKSIPTVVFTTSSSIDDIVGSYIAHANAYVTKPIDLADYERAIIAVCNFYGESTAPLGCAEPVVAAADYEHGCRHPGHRFFQDVA